MSKKHSRKLTKFLAAAALGLTGFYRKKAADWAKIEAATCYVKGVELVRRQCLFLALHVFVLFVLAAALVIFPLVLVLFLPLSDHAKLIAVALLGTLYIGAPILLFSQLFSEKRWLSFTQSNRIIEKVTQRN